MGVEDYTKAEEWIKSNLLTTVLTDHTENAFWVMHKDKTSWKTSNCDN